MAKDPAFLFYPNDYIGGTMGMTFEEKGAYMELLMLQFNRGHMTTHMIGQTIGHLWDNIKDKFVQDEQGKWYNVRLEEEKIKRANFTKSRRNNVSGANQHTKKTSKKRGHMGGHTTTHMENENENENRSINVDVILPFDSDQFIRFWDLWKDYKKKEFGFKFKSKASEQAMAKQLATLAGGDESLALQIIERSMANGWKGFFPIDKKSASKSEMDEYKESLKQRMKQ